MRFKHILLAAALVPAAASAQTALTTANYTQDFNTLASTGSTSSTVPAGFAFTELGTNANTTYAIGTGSSNAGGAYSFGSTGSSERAFGSLGSGSLSPIYFGFLFTNGLGSTITGFDFSYIGEQWRRGTSTDDGLVFEYSTNATSLTGGTWTAVNALDFAPLTITGAEGALDGNLAANRAALSSTIGGLSILAGQNFAFRWTDVNSGGNDHGLAIDDVRIISTLQGSAVPEPATWAMMMLGFGAIGTVLRKRARTTARVRFA